MQRWVWTDSGDLVQKPFELEEWFSVGFYILGNIADIPYELAWEYNLNAMAWTNPEGDNCFANFADFYCDCDVCN